MEARIIRSQNGPCVRNNPRASKFWRNYRVIQLAKYWLNNDDAPWTGSRHPACVAIGSVSRRVNLQYCTDSAATGNLADFFRCRSPGGLLTTVSKSTVISFLNFCNCFLVNFSKIWYSGKINEILEKLIRKGFHSVFFELSIGRYHLRSTIRCELPARRPPL